VKRSRIHLVHLPRRLRSGLPGFPPGGARLIRLQAVKA
jgi:hypothetical protein